MWAIENQTRYQADSTWVRDKDGVHSWVVAVKGTFDIAQDGVLTLAKSQLEPLVSPVYNGAPGLSSLRYDADLDAPKPTTDILLNGTAYAPLGQPAKGFDVSMTVGPVHKALRVVGDRWWLPGGAAGMASGVTPVKSVPLVYERAYGGLDKTDPDPRNQRMDARNPCGCGVVARIAGRVGQRLPNLLYPDGAIDKTGPAGFGAIDRHWSPRRAYAGTYDEAWQESRMPLLPADWDPRFLLCAPADQQPPDRLTGGETVKLVNLSPGGMLSFRLPRAHLVFDTRVGTRRIEHRSHVATVIIEPDAPRVIMVWVTALPCGNDGDYLEETVITEKERIR
jgi:hypothetical protein